MKTREMKLWLFLCLLTLAAPFAGAQEKQAGDAYGLLNNIAYAADSSDEYARERCVLDLYYPKGVKDFSTVVWFHGGGLTEGEKYIPQELKDKGIAVVAVNYRLSPKATHPAYIEDAAAAVAWTFRHIAEYGGHTDKVYVSGHSAGGYLALMLALDKEYLGKHEISPKQVAAWFPLSGQTMTHYTIKRELGNQSPAPLVDRYAPCANLVAETSPIVLVTGERKLELSARYEENVYLKALLESVGNKRITLYELPGFDHGNMFRPGCLLLADYIKKHNDK